MRSRHSLFVHSPELLVFFCSWKMGDVWDAAALGSVCALDVPKKRAFVPSDWTVRNGIVFVVCVPAAECTGNWTDFFLFRVGIGTLSICRPSNRNCLSAVYLALQCDFSADSHGFVYSDAAKSSTYADVWAIACRGHSFNAVHLGTVDLVSHADASGRAKRNGIFLYSSVWLVAGAVAGTVVLFLLGYRKIFAVRPDCRCSLDAL